MASTNEERFVGSCQIEGEVDVRQKLAAGRYSENRAVWATRWLETVESGKSDATKAEERSTRGRGPVKSKNSILLWVLALLVAVAAAIVLLQFK